MIRRLDAGDRFGNLTFVSVAEARISRRIAGVFRCDCGSLTRKPIDRVATKRAALHCGCKTDHAKSAVTHGMKGSPEYSSWSSMKDRCHNPRSKDFVRYGGRGIAVCDEWRASFEAFLNHIGPRPCGTSVDRIDNSRGYEPGNVRWASPQEQARNRSNSPRQWVVKGLAFATHKEAADHFAVSENTVRRWIVGSFDERRGTYTKPRSDCYAA